MVDDPRPSGLPAESAPSRWRYPVGPEMTERRALAAILETLLDIMVDQEDGVAGQRDVEGYRRSLEVLQAGHRLIIFPEGHLSRDGNLRRHSAI